MMYVSFFLRDEKQKPVKIKKPELQKKIMLVYKKEKSPQKGEGNVNE